MSRRFYSPPKDRRRRPRESSRRPEVNRGVLVVFLFACAGLTLLSFFKLAGTAGIFLDSLQAVAFGHTRILVPLVILAIAVLILRHAHYPGEWTHTAGFLLFFLGLNGLVHLRVPAEESFEAAIRGEGGGLFGYLASFPAQLFIGFWGALLVLAALLIVSLTLIFTLTPTKLVSLWRACMRAVFAIMRFPLRLCKKLIPARPPEVQIHDFRGGGFTARQLDEGTEAREDERTEEQKEYESTEKEPPLPFMKAARKDWKLPPLELLHPPKGRPAAGDIEANIYTIRKTLENFGISVEMGEVQVGPTVTQYTFKPAEGVKLARITALSNDLSLALAAHPIRIEAPIPGKSLVGIEVPNQRVATVTLRELLDSKEFKNHELALPVALGKDVSGKAWFADLSRAPHMLVAGATGSGKTVSLNAIICSLLYQHTPETLRFIMVDPKRVELPLYDGIPHLMTPVITDVPRTVNALKWCIAEMERRFDALAKAGRRDIASYNKGAEEKMPWIVFVVDELADLMAAAGAEIEAGVIRLAQMARAVGIHLILATQRPSVDILTGLIKANVPTRLAFSVASLMDSRTILDASGAEKLLGRGDMLYTAPELSKPKRLQGAYVSEEEIVRVADFLKNEEPPSYDMSVVEKPKQTTIFGGAVATEAAQDPLFEEAKELVVRAGKASASYLQRRLKVGYARAARLIDLLEEAGVVGPGDGAKPREVLLRQAEGGSMEGETAEEEVVDNETEKAL